MQNKFLSALIAVSALCGLTSPGYGQGISLDDYLREGGAPRAGYEAPGVEGKASSIIAQGVLKFQNKEYDGAASYFTLALQAHPDAGLAAKIYQCRAEAYIGKKEFKKAIADATEAIRLDRQLTLAYNTRGVAYGSIGDMTKAIADFDAASKLDPHLTEAKRNRELALQGKNRGSSGRSKINALVTGGLTACENKQFERAIASFTSALQLKPETAVAARIYDVRARAYGQKNDCNKALADANEAIRLNPQLGEAYNTRGCAYECLGDISHALSDFDTSIRLAPDFASPQNNRARLVGQKK